MPEMPSAPIRMTDDYYEAAADRMEFDLAALERVVTDVTAFRRQREKTVVVFPLNFRSFCAPDYGRRYMQALRKVPHALAEFIMPKFVRIPVGAPQSLIAEKVSSLSPLFRYVLVQTPPNLQLSRFQHTSCAILTTSWRDVARLAGGDTINMLEAVGILDDFRRFAADRDLKCAVEGADTINAVEAAAAVGADFVAGTAIGARTSGLTGQRRLTIEDIRAAHWAKE